MKGNKPLTRHEPITEILEPSPRPKVVGSLRILQFPPTGKVDRVVGNTGPQELAHAFVVTLLLYRSLLNKINNIRDEKLV